MVPEIEPRALWMWGEHIWDTTLTPWPASFWLSVCSNSYIFLVDLNEEVEKKWNWDSSKHRISGSDKSLGTLLQHYLYFSWFVTRLNLDTSTEGALGHVDYDFTLIECSPYELLYYECDLKQSTAPRSSHLVYKIFTVIV